jgi:tRNA A37 methylthiotransferase MiaB
VFRYSARPETRAALEAGRAGHAASRERSERLRALGAAKRRACQESLVGTVLPAIPEGAPTPRGACLAMTDVYAPVRLARRPETRGILPIRVDAWRDGTLEGTAIG